MHRSRVSHNPSGSMRLRQHFSALTSLQSFPKLARTAASQSQWPWVFCSWRSWGPGSPVTSREVDPKCQSVHVLQREGASTGNTEGLIWPPDCGVLRRKEPLTVRAQEESDALAVEKVLQTCKLSMPDLQSLCVVDREPMQLSMYRRH